MTTESSIEPAIGDLSLDPQARRAPESFLRLIRRSRRGRLKVYLGYAPGVGKTYQMLLEGHRLREQGVDVVIGGVRRTIQLGASTPALIERAVAGAEIEELENRLDAAGDADTRALRADIATRSVRARVISSQTSMLVLETEADYQRVIGTRNG